LNRLTKTINSYAKYSELAEVRRGQERCLKYSSYVVIPYKPAKQRGGFKEKGDFMYHSQHPNDVEYPDCGGRFYEKDNGVRFHGKFEPQFYTTDGMFIESYYD